MHLKDDEGEFADGWRLRSLVRKYSDHISIPVEMIKTPTPEFDDDGKEKPVDENAADEWECVNNATALWSRPRTEIPDDEYQEFYKHISHDFDNPLSWSHY
jgi:molecular chaperone HtpG